ncbi:MAG: tetratricopeptide repeat protein [Elusimicrobia bacterium]|nr:tetratricopeptide repeat protein [Elusimicrobiota bacterium]
MSVPESPANLNIFQGAPASFRDALPLFSGAAGAALPVQQEAAGPAQLYTIAPAQEGGQPALPAFTCEELLNPPFIRKSLAETAALFFHAPAHEVFVFNPRHPLSRFETSPLKASRLDISLLAGFLKLAGKNLQGDPAGLAAGEFALGNLHSAHYLYDAAAARSPASRARFKLGTVLVELGLLQEAYDSLKNDTDPEALLCLAVIHRKTGNTALARKALSALGQSAQLEERRVMETAWLDLEEGKEEEAEKAFQRLTSTAFDKVEALSGLGAAMARTAFRTKDRSRLSAAAAALRSALSMPAPSSAHVFFQLGNLYFRSGDAAQAEACYRRSAALAPSVQSLANLALTLIKTGKPEEAAAVTSQIALTDLASARRLAAGFPGESLASLFQAQPRAGLPEQGPRPAASAPALRPEPAPAPAPQPAPAPLPGPEPGPAAPAPAEQAPSSLDAAGGGYKFINPSAAPRAPAAEATPLAPAQPKPSISGRQPKAAAPAPAPSVRIETVRDVMASASQPTEEESRKDDFISRAFKLASSLEDELGRKIYYNLDGLNEVERKLRVKFIKGASNPQGNLEAVRDSAAFLCYFLQERFKGRLIKMEDFDPWGWPMIFELPGLKVTTYPVQRVWRLLWEEAVPEPGWLTKYSHWIADRLKETSPPPCGAAAARAKVMSHEERLVDARTEHKRMLVLISSLSETSGVELGRTGLLRLETAIKAKFRPDIPPTADGWKLLRCYGHLLAAILAKDFKAAWYNVDGEDGGWSMQLPWRTFVFPLGKIYKTASLRDDLDAYYEVILQDKLRYRAGPKEG